MPKLDHHISGELHYRHRKGLLLLSQLGGFGWRDIGEILALYFGGVHYQHKKGLLLLSQQSGFGWRDIGDTLAPYFGEVHYWHKKGLLFFFFFFGLQGRCIERTSIVKSAGWLRMA